MLETNYIESLAEKATFDQAKLNDVLEAKKRYYDPIERFVYTTPQEMIEGLFDSYGKGYTPSNYLHQIIPPSFYGLYLTKPVHIQQDELVSILATAEAEYRGSVEQAKEEYIQALAEQRVKELERLEWARSQAKRDKEFEKAVKEITQQLEEGN